MPSKGEALEKLYHFLAGAFDKDELERFLTFKGYRAIRGVVNSDVGYFKYVFNVVDEMDYRGLVDTEFFERLRAHLTQAGSNKAGSIGDLEKSWLSADPEGLDASDGPTVGAPRTSISGQPAASPRRNPACDLEKPYPMFTNEELQEIRDRLEHILRLLMRSVAGIPESSMPFIKLIEIDELKQKIQAVDSELATRS